MKVSHRLLLQLFLLLTPGMFACAQIMTSNFQATMDTYTSSLAPSTVMDPASALMYAKSAQSPSPIDIQRAYMAFNFKYNATTLTTGVPANAKIVSARIILTVSGSEGSSSLSLHRVLNSWDHTTITHNNSSSFNFTDQTTGSFLSGKRIFIITDQIKRIQAGRSVNFGWRLRHAVETSTTPTCAYHTLNASLSTNRPVLEIKWYIPLQITAATLTHETTEGLANGSITPIISGGLGTKSYSWFTSSNLTTPFASSTSIAGRGRDWYGLCVADSILDTLYIAFLLGTECVNQSITFNPGKKYIADGTVTGRVDSNIGGLSYVYENYGNDLNFQAGRIKTTYSSWFDNKGLLRFQLWMDPAISLFHADLYLSGNAHQTSRENSAHILQVAAPWSEYEVCHMNTPTTVPGSAILLPSTTTASQSDVVDLLGYWNNWKNNNAANYGLLLRLADTATTGASLRNYRSSDASVSPLYMKFDFTVSNGCEYFTLKPTVEQSVAYVTGRKLRLKVEEDYFDASGNLTYTLTSLTSGVTPAVTTVAKPSHLNWIELLLGTGGIAVTNGNVYLLEIADSKGRKMYFKFKKAA